MSEELLLKFLEEAYKLYTESPSFLLKDRILSKVRNAVEEMENVPKHLIDYINVSTIAQNEESKKRMKVIDDAEEARNRQQELTKEAEEKNRKLSEAMDSLKQRESELQQKQVVIEEAKAKIEAQKQELEKELAEEQKFSLQLSKSEGIYKISVRIVWVVGILCLVPAVLYALYQSDKLLDIFENIVILAIGTYSGYLLGQAGVKNFKSSEGKTQVSGTYDYDA